ncbi:MAG: 2,3-diphosphoglycerate synthetase [Actinomycetota bacterium]
MKVLVLVDGEHYPSVTRWGLAAARSRGHEVVAALFLGGTEKVDPDAPPDLGVTTFEAGDDQAGGLRAALERVRAEAVLDLSDEPILGYRERMGLIGVALAAGVPYLGSDFRFDPPVHGPPLPVPTIAVIGTGKRTGKTAIGGQLARAAADRGLRPIVVAMGRGGPAAPQFAEAGSVTLERLLQLLDEGQHAASDYLEDALLAGVATVGARRAGGGMAGAAYATNAREAAEVAVNAGAELIVLEGSGSTVPPIPWDTGILVVPASSPPEYVGGYLGPYRLLRSDLVVVTMAQSPNGAQNLSPLTSHVTRWHADARLVVTDFEPHPSGDVKGKTVFLATTAPEAVAERHVAHLEAETGCRVVGRSAHLADRARLREDMDRTAGYQVLLTELKAAAVDVACRTAIDAGAEVVFMENRAVAIEGERDVESHLNETIDLALARGGVR